MSYVQRARTALPLSSDKRLSSNVLQVCHMSSYAKCVVRLSLSCVISLMSDIPL